MVVAIEKGLTCEFGSLATCVPDIPVVQFWASCAGSCLCSTLICPMTVLL
jgi:hypothetical protein